MAGELPEEVFSLRRSWVIKPDLLLQYLCQDLNIQTKADVQVQNSKSGSPSVWQ
jgi:hypothetical protein